MNMVRIALANIRFPATPHESVALAQQAIAEACARSASIICFPEGFVPGYRTRGKQIPQADPAFLERAWSDIRTAAVKAENTCYFATVNIASAGSPTTSAVVRPDGTLLCYQPYGKEGLLIADIDVTAATGLLTARCKSV